MIPHGEGFQPQDIVTFFGIGVKRMFPRLLAAHLLRDPAGRVLLRVDARDGAGCPLTPEAMRRRNLLRTDINPFDQSVRHYWFTPVLPIPSELLGQAA